MGHDHAHHHDQAGGGGKRLIAALLLNLGITVAQVIGGVVSGSLSLIADAAHNGSDAVSLGVAYGAERLSSREADRRRTFGYDRAKVIGAMINLTTLFVIAAYLTVVAIQRFISPPEVEGMTMIIVGAIAFVEDAISVWLLYRGARHSMNMRAAFIHMVGDTLATLGVIVGGLLILWQEIYWIDPLITLAIAIYIAVHSYHAIRDAIGLLMESAPDEIDFDELVDAMERCECVLDVHHVHLWRLDEQRMAMEAHVAIEEADLSRLEEIKATLKEVLREAFEIEHSTLEFEVDGHVEHDRSTVPRE